MLNDEISLNLKLPKEMICNVLSRLPVKSLLQLMVVCKLWLSIISSPYFVKLHLSKSKNNEVTQHRFIYDSVEFNCCSLYSLFDLECIEPDSPTNKRTEHKRDYKAEIVGSCSLSEPAALYLPRDLYMLAERRDGDDFRVEVVDSCNGLVCLAFDKHSYYSIFLWNPSTRKSRRLPIWGSNSPEWCYMLYGFGYDEINDDYKVVGIYDNYDHPNLREVKVYSSKSDCWRKIENFPSALFPIIDHTKFANGAIHWASIGCDPPHPCIIASLNINREKFEEVHQPKFEEVPEYSRLAVMGECLSLICSYTTRCEIWMMKESGEEESWTKFATFPDWYEVSLVEMPPPKDSHSPTCISVDGHIVFKPSTKVHNSKDDKSDVKLEIRKYEEVIYSESLVSPNL